MIVLPKFIFLTLEQSLNIHSILVTSEKSKLDISISSNREQPLNKDDISLTFEVLKWDKSMDSNLEQP